MTRVSIKNLSRLQRPHFPYTAIAEQVLPRWDVSLVFVPPAQAKKLNEQLRKKTYVPNVLSYTVGEKNGEIIICLSEVKKQAPSYRMSERLFTLYLFIHGLLHLKGWDHGVTMERWEKKLMTQFAPPPSRKSYGTKNSHGHRHRNVSGKNRSR